jgi:hypothetical protein
VDWINQSGVPEISGVKGSVFDEVISATAERPNFWDDQSLWASAQHLETVQLLQQLFDLIMGPLRAETAEECRARFPMHSAALHLYIIVYVKNFDGKACRWALRILATGTWALIHRAIERLLAYRWGCDLALEQGHWQFRQLTPLAMCRDPCDIKNAETNMHEKRDTMAEYASVQRGKSVGAKRRSTLKTRRATARDGVRAENAGRIAAERWGDSSDGDSSGSGAEDSGSGASSSARHPFISGSSASAASIAKAAAGIEAASARWPKGRGSITFNVSTAVFRNPIKGRRAASEALASDTLTVQSDADRPLELTLRRDHRAILLSFTGGPAGKVVRIKWQWLGVSSWFYDVQTGELTVAFCVRPSYVVGQKGFAPGDEGDPMPLSGAALRMPLVVVTLADKPDPFLPPPERVNAEHSLHFAPELDEVGVGTAPSSAAFDELLHQKRLQQRQPTSWEFGKKEDYKDSEAYESTVWAKRELGRYAKKEVTFMMTCANPGCGKHVMLGFDSLWYLVPDGWTEGDSLVPPEDQGWDVHDQCIYDAEARIHELMIAHDAKVKADAALKEAARAEKKAAAEALKASKASQGGGAKGKSKPKGK